MLEERRCKKCGVAFVPINHMFYCADSFCSDCLEEPLNDVVQAEKEAYTQYRRMGYDEWKAKDKAYEFAQSVAREREKRGC